MYMFKNTWIFVFIEAKILYFIMTEMIATKHTHTHRKTKIYLYISDNKKILAYFPVEISTQKNKQASKQN